MIEKIRKLLNPETVSYLVFGVLTTVVNYAVYYPCRYIGIPYWIANVIAWIFAVAFAFVTNKLIVFKSKSFDSKVLIKEIVLFAGARIFSLVCETGFLVFTVEALHFSDGIMKLIAAVFVVVINYVFSKLFIFKKEK
ncbi:GtrA family protein [Cuneatibacter sp. NSJ-177]|uniref:GtrA family protein n=1 Tax=Cuneatibacter sp. NSJ-177 TaxID=2931401 RepID=UPI001FD53B83|nr:GtrA family protein [Cuneatibacter sp. NSJ-177]MCJ7835433.1 GtrA family protein [Cuneatibacter sp. NSJ-177]